MIADTHSDPYETIPLTPATVSVIVMAPFRRHTWNISKDNPLGESVSIAEGHTIDEYLVGQGEAPLSQRAVYALGIFATAGEMCHALSISAPTMAAQHGPYVIEDLLFLSPFQSMRIDDHLRDSGLIVAPKRIWIRAADTHLDVLAIDYPPDSPHRISR